MQPIPEILIVSGITAGLLCSALYRLLSYVEGKLLR